MAFPRHQKRERNLPMLELFARLVVVTVFLVAGCTMALAVNPDEVLRDPALETRARSLSAEIRCLVCQNQSIDDSDAQLAKDLRLLVREQLVEGKTDQQILDYLVERYGEFVLLKPRFSVRNLALWLLPFLALVAGIWLVRGMFIKRKTAAASSSDGRDLSPEEQAELRKILEK